MNFNRVSILITALFLTVLAGCTPEIRYIDVLVPVDRPVSVPAELTQPSILEYDQPETWADIAKIGQNCLIELKNCNDDKTAIRDLK